MIPNPAEIVFFSTWATADAKGPKIKEKLFAHQNAQWTGLELAIRTVYVFNFGYHLIPAHFSLGVRGALSSAISEVGHSLHVSQVSLVYRWS